MNRQNLENFLKFVFVGGFAAFVNFGSRFLFSSFMQFGAAVTISYLLGMVVAFKLFQKHVFASSKVSLKGSLIRFSIVNLFGLAQTVIVSLLVVQILPFSAIGLNEAIAHFIGMSLSVISSYFGHRFYTFRS